MPVGKDPTISSCQYMPNSYWEEALLHGRWVWAGLDAMKGRSLPLPGGFWKVRSIRLHQALGGSDGDSV
jgi:hypothetical protein